MSIFKNITLTIRIRSIDGWMDGRKEEWIGGYFILVIWNSLGIPEIENHVQSIPVYPTPDQPGTS